ncbi:Hypothetical predicted protein [Mytilus galloprovincialis]|uniref:Uncharacterized protein n=1 Tax=Mytilus galloprovincialis TaxID=29158 RepID=A0A8B6GE34_MYTGA|nr:Hypothetical predicted protein [Mytilus galloprovincialis]
MSELQFRSQIAVLGAGRVGKSSILQQYLNGGFSSAYKETVEDIYPQPYDINGKRNEENKRQVETFAALEWAYRENLGGCFIEVSAKDNNAVKEVFDMLLEQLGNRRSAKPETFRIRSTSFTRKENSFKKCRKTINRRRIRRWCHMKKYSVQAKVSKITYLTILKNQLFIEFNENKMSFVGL